MDAGSIRDTSSVGPVRTAPVPEPAPRPAPARDSPSWPDTAVKTDVSKPAELLRSLGTLAGDDFTELKTHYERDTDTNTLVFKAVDGITGDVVLQLPDESLLKFRAYLKQSQPAVMESTLAKSA